MKKYFLIFLILAINFSFSQKSKEQKIDSLKIALSYSKEDTIKVNTLNNLSSSLYLDDTKDGMRYADAALKLATKLKWQKGIGISLNNLGRCARASSNFSESLNYFYKAIKINENLEDKSSLAFSYNGLGLISHDLENFPKALNYFQKSLQLNTALKNQNEAAKNLNNIGSCLEKTNHLKKALHYYKKSLEYSIQNKDTLYIGFALTNIGITYNKLKDFPKAIEYINKSIRLYKDDSRLFNVYNKFELGRSYYLMGLDLPAGNKREQLLKKSLDLLYYSAQSFEKYNSLNDVQESYAYISKIHEELNNSQLALGYLKKSTQLKDSIFSTKIKDQIQNLDSQRKIDLRDQQIQIQELKIKSNSRLVYLLITITLVIALLLIVFFRLFLSKRKTSLLLEEKNKKISEINSQKDKFFSIIAHDLRGPFNGFLGLTELLAEDIDSMTTEEIKFAAVNMRNSAKNLFRLLENLLEWSRMEQNLISFVPKELVLMPIVLECIATIQDSAHNKEIEINTNISENTKVFADNNIIQAVIRNILSNAIKFTPKGGSIIIEAKEDNTKTTISITDTGIGIDPQMIENLFQLDMQTSRKGTDDEPSTGLGLILCKEFMEKHGGEIWIESEEEKGTTFYFSFPKENNFPT
jgi:signal transduction histidine kinase/Tfp pilus assembly protein PilF